MCGSKRLGTSRGGRRKALSRIQAKDDSLVGARDSESVGRGIRDTALIFVERGSLQHRTATRTTATNRAKRAICSVILKQEWDFCLTVAILDDAHGTGNDRRERWRVSVLSGIMLNFDDLKPDGFTHHD
jgi:hypothetical protein